jgi:hypothetical protein
VSLFQAVRLAAPLGALWFLLAPDAAGQRPLGAPIPPGTKPHQAAMLRHEWLQKQSYHRRFTWAKHVARQPAKVPGGSR